MILNSDRNSSLLGGPRGRAIRLIEYLLELSRIQSKKVREIYDYQSIKDYDSILWLCDIPNDSRYCYCRSWNTEEERDKEIWIEVQKYSEPVLEGIPDICNRWVNNKSLNNTEDMPELFPAVDIQERVLNPDATPDDPEEIKFITVTKTLHLSDFPNVSRAWEEFIDRVWIPWADLHQRWQSIQKVYSKLFSIYQLQKKLGEKYELVLGLGVLSWLTPTGNHTQRSLITAKPEIIFEARIGKFMVKSNTAGADLTIEFDMLDVEDHPPGAKQKAEEELKSAYDDPWDRNAIDPILRGLANSFAEHGQGEYYPECLEGPSYDKVQKKPTVDFAPALYLRERSERGLEIALQKMKEQILNNIEIPLTFLDLCESKTNHFSDMGDDGKILISKNGIIYFPKPFNKEQLQIVEKLQSSPGILVQGPPGTGKSHTIANLICHLLATGQRVLVTAKTPRALKVLHDLLPDQIKPLCISLLGSGIEEQKSLEQSVKRILSKQDEWHEADVNESINKLQEEFNKLKSEKVEIENRIRSIREADTAEQTFLAGKYHGTTAQIAKRIQAESEEFCWLKDEVSYSQELPISPDEIHKLRLALIEFASKSEIEHGFSILDLKDCLPSPEVFRDLFHRGNQAKKECVNAESLIKSPIGQLLDRAELAAIKDVMNTVSNLLIAIENIRKKPGRWISNAINDMLTDNDIPWKDMLRVFNEKLEGLKSRAKQIDSIKIEIPDPIDHIRLLEDAKRLKAHFDSGGKMGWGPLKPKIIRENKYIMKNIKINGSACNNTEMLQALIEFLSVKRDINYCWNLWLGKAERKYGPAFLQVAEMEELQKALESVVSMYDLLAKARKSTKSVQGLNEPMWHDSAELSRFLDMCRAIISKRDYEKILEQWKTNLNKIQEVEKQNIHPITREFIKKAIENLRQAKFEEYSKILEQSKRLLALNNFNRLSKSAPLFAKELRDYPADERWVARLENIEKAWMWRRAISWLTNFLNKDDLPSLERRIGEIDKETRNCIAELSSALAWKFCFRRMGDEHRRSLVGWQQAINRLGKGTGKHAPRYRRDAQNHLNKCKDAIPAWVMPLHRIYESVDAAPGIFDVVVIDEASQCGFEALPLTYLAKRIMIVGDDKQISPEAVGVERDIIFQKIKEYLGDFEHSDLFYVESSIFDHGQRRFGKNCIALREHFRCMPEIIQFSNDTWYNSTLIPLRQYPPRRLDPIVSVYVPNGYREGKGARAINKNEAQVLVEKVIQCCSDVQYENKTMGVIALQGDAQASLIEEMLLKNLGANEMENRRLICGNSYSFQGDERDVIFLSMVAAPNEQIGVLSRLPDQRRFNVACSRAKDQLWLIHSVTRSNLSKACLRWKLLEYFEDPRSRIAKIMGIDANELIKMAHNANRQIDKPPSPFESWFEVDVALEIASQGYRFIPQYEIAGKRIDLIVEDDERRVAIECDGDHWHGLEQYEKDVERQRILERCGWRFQRIRESAFYAFREKTLEQLWGFLERNGIRSLSNTSKMPIGRQEKHDSKFELISERPSDLAKQNELFPKRTKKYAIDSQIDISYKKTVMAKPTNIQEALDLKLYGLKEIIIETLKMRPNYSCIRDALPSFVLKYLKIVSRRKPREKFMHKAFRALTELEKESKIKIYKSKNVRVKLID